MGSPVSKRSPRPGRLPFNRSVSGPSDSYLGDPRSPAPDPITCTVGAVVQRYLRLVGPAILAALAAGTRPSPKIPEGRKRFHLGIESLAVALAVVLIACRGNVFVGILMASVLERMDHVGSSIEQRLPW